MVDFTTQSFELIMQILKASLEINFAQIRSFFNIGLDGLKDIIIDNISKVDD